MFLFCFFLFADHFAVGGVEEIFGEGGERVDNLLFFFNYYLLTIIIIFSCFFFVWGVTHVVVHFDDILIYLKTSFENMEHVNSILVTQKEKFPANFNNGSFCMKNVHFIGFIVGKNEVEVINKKLK